MTSLVSPSRVPASASAALDLHLASQAARALLDASASDVAISVRRAKGPRDPAETLISGGGRIEPAPGRGHVRFDFSGLFANADASEPPNPASIVELTWTPHVVFARSGTKPKEAWTTSSTADARTSGGYAGRLPDEILGLVRLVATSRRDEFVALEDASIDGRNAQRWRVTVPVEEAIVEGVPAEIPDAMLLRDTYGIDTLDLEVWLVDGDLQRIGYELARDEAPYGGPDRTTVTYDWSEASSTEPILVPPPP